MKNWKWTASPKRQKKKYLYPISHSPLLDFLPMLTADPVTATILSTLPLLYQQFTTVQAANRLPSLFVHLIYCLRKPLVNSPPTACRALKQSLCKSTAKEVPRTSFQLFLIRYFLQLHPLNTNSLFYARPAKVWLFINPSCP